MKAMIHKLSKAQKSVIASFLALVMVFGVFALIAPVEAQAVELNATSTAFSGGLAYIGEDGITAFDAGAQIRVINKTRDGKNRSDAIYVTDGIDNWSPVDTDNYLVWQGVDANTFYGIYPATANYTEFMLPTDQSSIAKLAAADWMTDDYEEPKSDGFVTLDFQHRLTKVTVKIVQWNSEYADAEKVVSEQSIHSKGLELDAAYGDTVEIIANDNGGAISPVTTADYEYTAIVMPAAYESTDTFFTFTVDGTPLTVSVGNNATLTNGLEAGKHYSFELTVGRGTVTLNEVTVEGWKDGGTIEGGVAEEVAYELTDEMVSLEYEDVVYTGEIFTPEVTVIADGTVLTKDTDYTVEYGPNMDPGWGIVTVTGKGRWTGTVTKQFMIAPRS